MDLQHFEEALLPVVHKARRAILEIYADVDRFNIEYKDDESPLTAADRTSNRIICEALNKLSPDIPIISEENREVPYEVRRHYTYCWLVDPIDGTKEFIKRNGEFTINVALVHEGRPILGLVDVPVQDETFVGMLGGGAKVISASGVQSLQCRRFTTEEKGLTIVCSRSHLSDTTREFVNRYKRPHLLARGSALKFTVIAAGDADIYPRLGPTMEWDTAAAQILLEEAGGKMLDFVTRQPLLYNKENLLNPNFIAFGNGEIAF